MSAVGDAIAQEALNGLGTCENSRGLAPPYTDTIGAQAWCGSFIEYCYRVNGVNLHSYTSNPYYVSTYWADMKKRGFNLAPSQAEPGDAAFYNWDGGREDHVEIVIQNKGNGVLDCVGGNVSNCVKRQDRSGHTLIGVARVPELRSSDSGGTGGPGDPDVPTLPDPIGMDYGLNIYSAEERNNRLYEGPLQYCAHNSLLGWDVSAMGRGVAATKFSIWTQRGNYCLDTVSVVWDFAGKPNPD